MSGRPAPSLALLAAITALAFCGLHMVVPALPLLVTVFADTPAHVQLVVSLYLAGIATGQLIYGPVSDRFGRRSVLLAGLAAFLVGTAVCGAAWSLPALIAGRVLQALGACAGVVLSRAVIRDVYEREAAARGLALVMMAMTLAPAISPIFGAYLAEWFGWRAIFAVLGGLGSLVLVATVMWLGETNRRRVQLDLAGMAGANFVLLRSPAFVGFAVCGACTSASWFTFIAGAPHILAEALQRPPSTYGLMILLPMATYMLGNAAAARFAPRFGSLRLLLAGRALAFAAARDGAVGRFGASQHLGPVRADRDRRNRRRPKRACGNGGGAQHPSAACRHCCRVDGLSADGRRRSRQFCSRVAAAPERARLNRAVRWLCRARAGCCSLRRAAYAAAPGGHCGGAVGPAGARVCDARCQIRRGQAGLGTNFTSAPNPNDQPSSGASCWPRRGHNSPIAERLSQRRFTKPTAATQPSRPELVFMHLFASFADPPGSVSSGW
jgi:MFS transporter, DHA1 family, multidrug resistance protein